MDKITNFDKVKTYFCTKCNKFHKKTIKRNGVKLYSKPFNNHKEFGVKLTSSELWNYKFKKSWKRYNLSEVIGT